MAELIFSVDQALAQKDQRLPGHNRWHPDIPAAAAVKPYSEVRIECLDFSDGQVRNDNSTDDIRAIDVTRAHALSGPFAVEGAKPGDLLVLDILDVGAVPGPPGPSAGQGWGYTAAFPRTNGGSFLVDQFPDACKAIWDINGRTATSRHIPGVSFFGVPHPGIVGTAPSHNMLRAWNQREAQLVATDPSRVPPLAVLPSPDNAVGGSCDPETLRAIGEEGARTPPPRENGGNVDIKNYTRGARLFYPVFVDDAMFSVGDLHFSQGDGEIAFCGGIEMGGYIDLRVDVIKGGMDTYGIANGPAFMPGALEPAYSRFMSFVGVSYDAINGKHSYMDATLAFQNACLNAIEYLGKFGYTAEQVYLLLAAAPVEARISAIVDIPNACCTLYVPTDIFDFDIMPSHGGPVRTDRGQVAL
ncbi:MAG: formamidase [Marmoricola sp.]|nr:formamidase [Marmoricola sp.]